MYDIQSQNQLINPNSPTINTDLNINIEIRSTTNSVSIKAKQTKIKTLARKTITISIRSSKREYQKTKGIKNII